MRSLALLGLLTALLGFPLAHAAPSSPFRLIASDFTLGSPIPARHEGNVGGCSGRNVPPTLRWSGAPAGTRSFALIMIDPDAPVPGGFVHWIVYNIPASRHVLDSSTLSASKQGRNGANVSAYTGPCPPPGSGTHHYHFTLYALRVTGIGALGMSSAAFQRAIKGKVLRKASLIGTFTQ